MKFSAADRLLLILGLFFLGANCFAANNTPLVSGNGLGFAVFSLEKNVVSKLYTHPYKFEKENPTEELGEGFETPNLVKSLRWVVPDAVDKVHYLDQSQIIRVESGNFEQSFFMPFSLNRRVLICSLTSTANSAKSDAKTKFSAEAPYLSIDWEHALKNSAELKASGRSCLKLQFEGIEESVLLLPLESTKGGSSKKHPSLSATKLANCNSWAVVALEPSDEPAAVASELLSWAGDSASEKVLRKELGLLEAWRAKPRFAFRSEEERELWRQSEVILRMGQSRETNRPDRYNNGMVIASLPDGAWFVPWVRDMAYALYAFIEMGHLQEARSGLNAYLQARPVGRMQKDVGNLPYQVSVVRYFGDGAEQPYFTMEGSTNIEFDDWGLVLWVMGEYVSRSKDYAWLDVPTYRGTVYDNAKEYIVKPLLANLENFENGLIVASDTSIWEERQKDKKHFAFSTAAAIVGLEKFAGIAAIKHDEALQTELKEKVKLLKKGFDRAFVRDGRLHGTLEVGIKNDVDGAMLTPINWGITNDAKVIHNSVEAMSSLKMPSGGFRRVTSVVQDPAIFEYWYERQEFLFINFSLAEVYLRMHPAEPEKADALVKTMIERSARDNNIIPEMYVSEKNYRFTGEIGEPTGAVPMVGYGAGAYIVYLCHRAVLGGNTRHR